MDLRCEVIKPNLGTLIATPRRRQIQRGCPYSQRSCSPRNRRVAAPSTSSSLNSGRTAPPKLPFPYSTNGCHVKKTSLAYTASYPLSESCHFRILSRSRRSRGTLDGLCGKRRSTAFEATQVGRLRRSYYAC